MVTEVIVLVTVVVCNTNYFPIVSSSSIGYDFFFVPSLGVFN